jgi:hypothetical protein
MNNNNILNCALINSNIVTTNILNSVGTTIFVQDDLEMKGKDVLGVGDLTTSTISGFTANGDINLNANNITFGDNVQLNTISATQGTIGITDNVNVNNNDLLNINQMNIQNIGQTGNTRFITDVQQLPTAAGGFHLLEDNTSYIICGQLTLTNGLEYGANCSVTGVDFSASITFDETANDIIGFKSVNQNVYLSKLTIFGGGGRFTGNINYSTGLFSCSNFSVIGGFPFYGRSKRFKVDGCNFIKPYVVGQVKGFATLNFNNNLISGTGTFDIYEGLEVIDGLSLEFLGNKMVLFRGGVDPNSPAKLLRFGASIIIPVIIQKPEGLLGFNAVNVSSNIFHPRGNFENAIDFDATSRTGLGVISSNTFIRSGGTSPLINYPDQGLYDNYNQQCVFDYSINSNVGVIDSEPNLKSSILESTTQTSATMVKISPLDNSQINPIDISARIGIQLNLINVTTPFILNEIITDTSSTSSALIIKANDAVGNTQTIYISDMSGVFAAIPSTFTGDIAGATTSGGSLDYVYCYLEKDPRKLIVSGTFQVECSANNIAYSLTTGNGAPDLQCTVSGVSASSGAGSTVSIGCTRKFGDGDEIDFYYLVAAGNIKITKAIINIK